LWTGAQTRGGYGNLTIQDNGRPRMMRANRMSWILAHGTIPAGLNVLHNCPAGDNPLCVNPAHLWLGTHKQNTDDARQKGRLATGARHGLHQHPDSAARGEAQGNALLNAEQVLDIRYLAAHGMSQRLLGYIYGVGSSTVGQIVRGKNWKHLPLIVEER
jgi:HNH endonuclease